MADSAWVSAGKNDADKYEQNFGQGQPPTAGFTGGKTETTTNKLDDGKLIEWKITTWFSLVKKPLGSEDVREQCDRCVGHDHQLLTLKGKAVVNPPVYVQQHCAAQHFGDHSGTLNRFHLRGREIRRVANSLFQNGQLLPPTWTSWEERTIDHDDGDIIWNEAISCTPCPGKGQALAFAKDAPLIVALSEALMSAGGLAETATVRDAGALAAMTKDARSLRRPRFSIEASGPTIQAVLSDGNKAVGTLTLRRDAEGSTLRLLHWKRRSSTPRRKAE